MRCGVHMPLKGGFANNVRRLKELGCETVQIFAGNPTGWKMSAGDPAELAGRAVLLQSNGIHPLVIHSAYLINLASSSPENLSKSKALLTATMNKAALYSAPYVVLHTGYHGGKGPDEGLEQVAAVISAELSSWPAGVMLLLENTAGSGTALGSHFEEMARVVKVFRSDQLGICLDTAHAYAAGYDFSTAAGTEETLAQFELQIGLEYLKVIHVNDSATALGSRVDRHAHLGEGHLGLEGLRYLLDQPWPDHFPFILETPETGTDRDRVNLETLFSLRR